MTANVDADHARGRDRPLTFNRTVEANFFASLSLPWWPNTRQVAAANTIALKRRKLTWSEEYRKVYPGIAISWLRGKERYAA